MGVLHPSLHNTQLNTLETREGLLDPLSVVRYSVRVTQVIISMGELHPGLHSTQLSILEACEGLLALLSVERSPFFAVRKYSMI
jgi:hypothetical protein